MARAAAAPAAMTLIELDFGDSELIVREHPDGVFTLDVNDTRLVLSREDFHLIARAFASLQMAAEFNARK
jgi:hypothetical protein